MLPNIKIKNNRLSAITDITPDYVEEIFNSFNNIAIQSLIEQIISDDPDIIGLMQKRLSLPYYLVTSITPASDSNSDKNIAKFVYDVITDIVSSEVLTNIQKANFFRFSVLQLHWEINSGKYIPTHISNLPRTSFEFHPDSDELMIYDADNEKFSEIPENSSVIAISKFTKKNLPISLIRIIRKFTVIKLFSILDWSAFNEIYGMPLRLGKYSENSSEEDINNLYDAVSNLGSDAAAVISDKDSIDFISPKNDNPLTYEKLYQTCKNAQSTAILGNSNISGIDKNGSYAALKILSQVSEDIILSDITLISEAINKYLVTPLVKFNFSAEKLPKVEYKLPKSYKDLLEIDKKLSELGIKFNKDYFIRKYDLNSDDFELSPNEPKIQTPDTKKKTQNSSIAEPFI